MSDVPGRRHGPTWPYRTFVVTSAIVRKRDSVLLVEQVLDSGELGWSLPGGVVEPDEEVTAALVREVAEETGLRVAGNHGLAYAVQNIRATDLTVAFAFEVSANGRIDTADPDHEILSAAFFPLPEAVERLRHFPIRVMSEPAVAYLIGEEPAGTFWSYHDVDGRATALARVRSRLLPRGSGTGSPSTRPAAPHTDDDLEPQDR